MNKSYQLLIVVLGTAITTIYYIFDPAKTVLIPCLFQKLTGKYCFGCGGQRAFHELLHGNFTTAFHDNLLIYLLLPVLFLYFIGEVFNYSRISTYMKKNEFLAFYLLLLGIFMILRNIPIEPFTSFLPQK